MSLTQQKHGSVEKRLSIFVQTVPRRMLGPIRIDQETYRLRYSEKRYAELNNIRLTVNIRIQRLEWTGHILRIHSDEPTKKIFCGNIGGKRSNRRPKKFWIATVKDDANELGIKK